MLETWFLFSIFAGFLQSVRTGLQKNLTSSFSPLMITWARFLFGLPLAAAYLLALKIYGFAIPGLSFTFVFYIFLASIFQIIGSIMLTGLLRERNFAVGIAYSKTEAILAAIFAYILFQEKIEVIDFFAILLGFAGVVILSLMGKSNEGFGLKNLVSRTSIIGLTLGIFHALTAIFVREASLVLDGGDYLIKAGLTLFSTMFMQSIIMSVYLGYKRDMNVELVKNNIKKLVSVGAVGVITSICWYSAYALEQASYVNAVGQCELVFSIIATHLIFKEKIKIIEAAGIVLIIVSILTLIL